MKAISNFFNRLLGHTSPCPHMVLPGSGQAGHSTAENQQVEVYLPFDFEDDGFFSPYGVDNCGVSPYSTAVGLPNAEYLNTAGKLFTPAGPL